MRRVNAMLAVLCAAGCSAGIAQGQVFYSQNFEAPVTAASGTVGPAGFVQANDIGGSAWQVQGGGGAGGVILTSGIDANGVAGSQALFADWNHTPAAPGFFTFNQYTIYGVPGPGAGTPLNLIEVSMDIFMSGSESSNTPINILYQAGADASFTPTLANGAFTHVVYTLDQAGGGVPDPGAAFNLRLEHGAAGFGFDAANIVRVDNIQLRVVPEPAGMLLAGLLALPMMRRRRV